MIDIAIGVVAASAAIYLSLAENAIYERGVRLSTLDWVASAAVILCAIELTRRSAGIIIPILIILSLSYVVAWGSWIGVRSPEKYGRNKSPFAPGGESVASAARAGKASSRGNSRAN